MKTRRLLSLGEWQARELRLRDVLLLATVVIGQQLYIAKVNKPLCAAFSTSVEPSLHTQGQVVGPPACLQPGAAAQWGIAKRLSCGCALAPSWLQDGQPEGGLYRVLYVMATALVQASNTALQVLFRPYTLGWAVPCPLMCGLPVLVTLYLALLLLPMPYWRSSSSSSSATPPQQHQQHPDTPSSSIRARTGRRPDTQQRRGRLVTWVPGWQLHWRSPDWYWRAPGARVLLVVVFRAFLSILPPLSVGALKPAPHLLQFNGYLQWSPFVQYAWRGWGAFTQLLPWRVQLVVCACEALGGLYMTAAAHPAQLTRSSGMLALHLACNLMLCFALPAVASVVWERMSRKQYARYKAEVMRCVEGGKCKLAGTAADAWLCDYVNLDPKQQACGTTASSSSSSRGLVQDPVSCKASTPSCSNGSSASDTSDEHSNSAPRQLQASSEANAEATGAAAAEPADVWVQLHQKLARLVGSEAADNILRLPQGVRSGQAPRSPQPYMARCELTPVTIKVDSDHTALDTVGPLLRQTLEQALLTTWGADAMPASSQVQQQQQQWPTAASGIALQSVCFQGCIQLLASVYRPRRGPARGPGAPGGGGGYCEEMVAQRLLQLLQPRSAAGPPPAPAAAGMGRPLGLAVGASMQQLTATDSAGEGSSSVLPRIQLLWQDIPALTAGAGNQQQPVLVLDLDDALPTIVAAGSGADQVAGSADVSSSSSSCLVGSWARLMIFNDKQVLFDQLLQLHAAIRLSLPPLGVGAYHLAILQHDGPPPAPHVLHPHAAPHQQHQQEAGRSTVLLPAPQSSPSAVAVPLLLQPLLVLPQGPAQELQQLWNAGCQRLWATHRTAAAAAPPLAAQAPAAATGSSTASGSGPNPNTAGPQGGGSWPPPASCGGSGSEPLPSPMRVVQMRPDGTWFALSSTPVPLQKLLAQQHLVLAWQHMMCSLLQDVAFLLCWADGSIMAGPVSCTLQESGEPGAATASSCGAVSDGPSPQGRRLAASTTAAAGGGDAAPAGAPSELLNLQVVLQPLLHYLATHRMWALADFLVQRLLLRQQQLMQLVQTQDEGGDAVVDDNDNRGTSAAATGAATLQQAVLGAPGTNAVTSGSKAAAVGPVSGRHTPTAVNSPPAAAAAAAERTSDDDRDSGSNTPASSSSSSSSSRRRKRAAQPSGLRRRAVVTKDTQGPEDWEAAAAVDRLGAAQLHLEASLWQRHSLRQLFQGFASPQLETTYMQYAARMSATSDLMACLQTLLVTTVPGVGADLPAAAAAVGWRVALWRQRYDVVFLLLFVVPSLVVLALRPWLMYRRRREGAIVMAELGFLAMFVCPVLGWMSQASTSKICAAMSPCGWRSLAIVTSMSIFKPLSRQVRPQTFLPTIVGECILQMLFQHLRCGHSLLLAAARYGVILPVAICCCVTLERRRRWMFLQHQLAQQAAALQQAAVKRAGSPGMRGHSGADPMVCSELSSSGCA